MDKRKSDKKNVTKSNDEKTEFGIIKGEKTKIKIKSSNPIIGSHRSDEVIMLYKSDIPETRRGLSISSPSDRASVAATKYYGRTISEEQRQRSNEIAGDREISKGDMKPVKKKKKEKPILHKKNLEELEKEFLDRKTTYVDGLAIPSLPFKEIFSKVPKPKGAEIENGLPSWNNSPLDTKLTIIPSPESLFVCTRGKIGEKLWKSFDGGEFVFYDPYGYEVSIPYDPVHDKHLQKFFQNPSNVINLKKLGLVTEKDDAKCTLQEFNSYRRYLYKVYAESLRNAFYAKANKEMEEMQVQKALLRIKKEIQRQLKCELISKRHRVVEAQREEIRHEQENKCMMRLARVQTVQKYKETKKEASIREAEKRHEEFKNRILQRVIVAAQIEHKRKIDALLERQAVDLQFKLFREQDLIKRKLERERKVQERWEQKIRNQNFSIERENQLREKRANDLINHAKKRLKNNRLQLKRREQQLDRLKAHNKHEREKKYPMKKKAPKVRFEEESKESTRIVPPTIIKLVERFRKSQMFTDITRTDQYETKVVPTEVRDAIDASMTEAIKIFIKKQVESFVEKLLANSLVLFEAQAENWRARQLPVVGKRQSLMVELLCIATENNAEAETNNTLQLLNNLFQDHYEEDPASISRLVSFGNVETVEQVETRSSDIKCVKDREQTPVPSEDELAVSDFNADFNFIAESEMFPHKRKLFELIDYMGKTVINSLEARIVSHFSDSGHIVTLFPAEDAADLELKEKTLVEYIAATLVNVTETIEEIDEDECVYEVARYIAKHILLI